MERPIVSIVQPQTEQTYNVNVSKSEEYALLAKYGFVNSPSAIPSPDYGLSFEEMCRIEEQKIEQQRMEKNALRSVRSYSIDRERVQFHNTNYRTLDDDSSLGIEVQIVSDMKIPKY